MIKFIVGMLVGGFFGVTWMCLCSIVDDIDELAEAIEETQEEQEEEQRCDFCGGKLSEVRYNDDGIPYRYCYGCLFDKYIIDEYMEGDYDNASKTEI